MCGGELQACGGCGEVECREVVRNHLVFNECREVVKNHLVFNLTRSTFLKASINRHRLRNSLVCPKPADCVQTSPRLCNL